MRLLGNIATFLLLAALAVSASAVATSSNLLRTKKHHLRRHPPLSVEEASAMAEKHGHQSTPGCPCGNASLCKPLTTPMPDKELFAYASGGDLYNTSYNWSKITTVVWYSPPSMDRVCYAHSLGVRVILAFNPTWETFQNATLRATFATHIATIVDNSGLDGINMDFEEDFTNPVWSNYVTAGYYAIVDAVKMSNAMAQTSLCMATIDWWDLNTGKVETGFPFDFAALALKSDFFVVMMYGQSGPVPGANSFMPAIDATFKGMHQLASIPPSKLVLGFPWYGFDFSCSPGSINRNAGLCNSTADSQINYDQLVPLLAGQMSSKYQNVSEVSYNLHQWTGTYAWFTATTTVARSASGVSGEEEHLFIFDDPKTLEQKYAATMAWKGARGLSMWQASALGSSVVAPMPEKRQDMWSTINRYI